MELYGVPDVISERSGDLERRYVGGLVPDYKWPKSELKKLYYPTMETVVTIQHGRAIAIDAITLQEKEMVQDTIKQTEKGNGILGIRKDN
ncbi:MAG: hypothetical protein ACYTFX_09385 [Planctomycetota bacterium]